MIHSEVPTGGVQPLINLTTNYLFPVCYDGQSCIGTMIALNDTVSGTWRTRLTEWPETPNGLVGKLPRTLVMM
jgi:hypothetical protein